MSKSTTRLVRECPEDFIGQIIDIFEDDLTNAASDKDDGSSVHITGNRYDHLSDALRETLKKWNVLLESETLADTNADMLIDALQNVDDDEVAESVAPYINCPSSDDCGYQGGSDYSPCIACKTKWLRSTQE